MGTAGGCPLKAVAPGLGSDLAWGFEGLGLGLSSSGLRAEEEVGVWGLGLGRVIARKLQ